jgi:hypothetical protein
MIGVETRGAETPQPGDVAGIAGRMFSSIERGVVVYWVGTSGLDDLTAHFSLCRHMRNAAAIGGGARPALRFDPRVMSCPQTGPGLLAPPARQSRKDPTLANRKARGLDRTLWLIS